MERTTILNSTSADISDSQIRKTYDIYASLYDLVFGANLNHGRKRVIKLMDPDPDESILEIGIGTGISLKYYDQNQKIVGIDLSEAMLEKARLKALKYGHTNTSLFACNAENILLPSNSFDKVVIMYVYSVAANPLTLLDEAQRVCKTGGDVYIVNHFSNYNNKGLSFSEKILRKHAGRIGFRSDFSYDKYITQRNLNIQNVEAVNFMGLSRIVHLKNDNVS